jgi:eukaryotic-like serine/threonine-protein kinase
MSQDRDLLFGLLAVQQKKATPEAVREAARTLDAGSGKTLGAKLVEMGALKEDDEATLYDLADKTLEEHGGDSRETFATLGEFPGLADPLGAGKASEDDSQATLYDQLNQAFQTRAADPGATVVSEKPPPGVDDTFSRETVLSDPDQTRVTSLQDQMAAGGDAADAVPAVKEHHGRYRLLKEFAAGGMGKILLVQDGHIGREIALKQLLPDRLGAATPRTRTGPPTADMLTVPIIARFVQEARVTGQLEHPAIVPVYELGYRADGSLYYTMKFVRGRNLQDVLDETASFQDRLTLLATHFPDLCQAMAYAHSRGVIHRDLKPLNVMVGEFGETVVIDWGIAKIKGSQDIHQKDMAESVRQLQVGEAESTAKTVYGQTIGSVYYMPPEQAEGRMDQVDERSDVYALGAIMYIILTGRPPYAGMKAREFLEKVRAFPPKPIRDIEPAVPPELAAVCERAMARNPEDRYPSARELSNEIQAYISGGLVGAYQYSAREIIKRFVKKHRRVLMTAAIAAVLLAVLGVFSVIQIRQERDVAIQQRDRAEAAETEAVKQKDIAVTAEQRAVIARDEARENLYFANVQLSQRYIEEVQMARARQVLADCPADYREWEWGHLQYQCNADMMTLKRGGRYVVYTDNGKSLITARANGTVLRSNLEDGTLAHTFIEKAGMGFVLAASADGGRIAISGEKAVAVWDSASGRELFRYDETGAPLSRNYAAISGDGRRVAAMNTDKKARIWEIDSGKLIQEIPVPQLQGFGMFFSPDGENLLLIRNRFGENGWVRAFAVLAMPSGESLGEGALRDPLTAHTAAFSPDGAFFALGTDEGLQLWSVSPFEMRHELPGQFKEPDTIAFSPDGRWIAGGMRDGGVGVWDVAGGMGTTVARAHEDTVRAVTFSPDGKWLATAAYDRTAKLWETGSLRALRTMRGHDEALFALAFAPDGRQLATGSFDHSAKCWDLSAEVEFAPAQNMACQTEKGLLAGNMGNTVAVWDLKTGHRLHTLEAHDKPLIERALVFSACGDLLAAAAQENESSRIVVWNPDSGAKTADFKVAGSANRIAAGGNGRLLAVQSGTTLTLHELPAGKTRKTLEKVQAMRFSPEGRYFAAAAEDPEKKNTFTIHILETGSLEKAGEFTTTIYMPVIEFSPDGALLLAAEDAQDAGEGEKKGRIRVWEIAAAAERGVIPATENSVTRMAFSSSGARFAAGSIKGKIVICDTASLETGLEIEGHPGAIRALSFSPGGKRLVTGSRDGTFKLWDTASNREILTLHDEALAVTGLVYPGYAGFSADSLHLAVLTHPPVSPRVLHAFPSEMMVYPGDESMPLQERIEAFKRQFRD